MRRARIGRWHKGKLIILWTWTAVTMLGSVQLALALPKDSTAAALAGFGLFLLAVLAPIVMSAVTWIWLGARETDDTSA